MKLYTLQSIETIYLLHRDTIVYLHFGEKPPASHSNWKSNGEALITKYNTVKQHDFSSLPIQWYDNRSIATAHFNADTTGSVLIQAEIPEIIVLSPELITPYIDITWIVKRKTSPVLEWSAM